MLNIGHKLARQITKTFAEYRSIDLLDALGIQTVNIIASITQPAARARIILEQISHLAALRLVEGDNDHSEMKDVAISQQTRNEERKKEGQFLKLKNAVETSCHGQDNDHVIDVAVSIIVQTITNLNDDDDRDELTLMIIDDLLLDLAIAMPSYKPEIEKSTSQK